MTTNAARWGAERPQGTGLFSTLQQAVETFSRARAKRRTARALADLDDHVLADIGITPSEIRRKERAVTDWVLQSHSGTARLVFIGR